MEELKELVEVIKENIEQKDDEHGNSRQYVNIQYIADELEQAENWLKIKKRFTINDERIEHIINEVIDKSYNRCSWDMKYTIARGIIQVIKKEGLIMEELKDITKEKLLKEHKMLDKLIHGNNPCFGIRDVLRALNIENEIARRKKDKSV